ncbi:MAG: thiosulfohydrolase SoxB, partial [Chloroflexi bacterium]|nr:thiosulfohydrolase SoxB [Chloroflexota bacterium]
MLDAGDAWYGSAIALLTEGKACVEVMNAMGYDAMTMHWEFNLGKKALLQRIGEAKFTVLAQNLIDTDFGDRILTPSIIKEVGGVKVGIVGQAYPFSLLTTESRDVNPGWRMGYQEDTLQKEITQLRQEKGAQIIILLSHMGYDQDRVFADTLSGVDVIIGSHTHDI